MRTLAAVLIAFCASAQTRFDVVETTIPAMQAALESGAVTSKQLVEIYLQRIAMFPKINAIREINPKALEIAAEIDRRRAAGGAHGPLFGIPVLLKDNINTADQPTTAGSLALKGCIPPRDAFITTKLRDAGAIILGKANLTEFANYLTNGMPSGYSSLGGYVFNPYDPRPRPDGDGRPVLDPGGSSSGPGAAVAANLVAVAVGTETSGSILSPANANSVVGIKPTVGLISRDGIIPIAASQDTAGPMARTVTDAAILLGALTGVDPNDPATRESEGKFHADYTQFLKAGALKGARIGVPRAPYWDNLKADRKQLMEAAIAELQKLGAEVVDVEIPTAREVGKLGSPVFRYEFKRDLNAYLRTLGPDAPVKSLADVVAFNKAHADVALKYGQTLAIASDAVDLEAERGKYLESRDKDLRLAKEQGIDATMAKYKLDALLFPAVSGAAIAAKAGYPSVCVPAGYLADGAPIGVTFAGQAYSEPKLIGLAYAYEQGTKHRKPPPLTEPRP